MTFLVLSISPHWGFTSSDPDRGKYDRSGWLVRWRCRLTAWAGGRRHCTLRNGSLGWIQITNFAVTGVIVIACAIGIRRALGSGLAATRALRLLALYGAGLIAAGIFVADPMNGLPPGPTRRPSTVSLHGLMPLLPGLPSSA